MPSLKVERALDSQKDLIANLIQLYLYDMTSDLPFPVGDDGRFEYDYLDRFWKHPYLIRSNGEIAGFALVIENCPVTGTEPCFFMAEFFVLKAHRGAGVGSQAVNEIFAYHPGLWHVGVITKNSGAKTFWHKCLQARQGLTSQHHAFDGEDWLLYELSV